MFRERITNKRILLTHITLSYLNVTLVQSKESVKKSRLRVAASRLLAEPVAHRYTQMLNKPLPAIISSAIAI